MAIDKKILEEIRRYNMINNYIQEQALPEPLPPVGADAGADAGVVPPPPPPPAGGATTGGTEVVNVETDDEVEEVGDEGTVMPGEGEGTDEEVEEVDITDLIDTQKTMSEKQEEYFDNLFSQLEELQSKLGEMDEVVRKLDSLEAKVDRYKPKTPEEKLELRSLDSGPFKQKLSDFFEDKKIEMEKSGKNEYVLTSDDIDNYSPSEIQKSFDDGISPFDPEMYYK